MPDPLPPLLTRLVPPPAGITFPAGAETLTLETLDGLGLRAAFWDKPAAEPCRGSVFVLQGRAEFIEKYSEVFENLLTRGFAVAALDWRGQGGSARQLVNIAKGHVEDFEDFLLDLEVLLAEARRRSLPEPWHVLAHSMGGAITLLAIARGRAPFRRALLSAPLVKIHGIRSEGLARLTARTLSSLGLSGAFIPFGGKQPIGAKPFEGNVLSADPRRYARAHAWERAEPRLAIGDPTIGWVDAAFHALERFDDEDFGADSTTPVLILVAGADRVVDSPASEALARRLRAASAIVIPGARHELLMETDAIQAEVWAAFDAFIGAGAETQPASPEPNAAPASPAAQPDAAS